ncbi:inositol polyphosphate 5-phosphatase K isoform X1 [Aplysia californica]|uniref:Inositol polyphosphate 5-phosphatase K isoform X1 n=1 Tax=Aplysia californica TaxID=6500 RepID=A0ABM1A4U0_APLCA|nr:inositol polyphosphate 5-phosphatase K isoform X1 [Aplysia californica]
MPLWDGLNNILSHGKGGKKSKFIVKSQNEAAENFKMLTAEFEPSIARVYLVTWNVHNQPPPTDLADLLGLDIDPSPDVYGIGLQEAFNQEWVPAISQPLFKKDYVRVKARRLQGIVTVMFVRRALLPFVTSVESEITKTGLGGFWGNKGGVSLRMDFMGLNFIVVNCHLAAHQDQVAARLLDIDSILDSQKFKDADTDNILDHDYIFWMGDMNFRLEDTPYEHAVMEISKENFPVLLANDQLNLVREEGLAFENFKEGPITFAPTYKFDPSTDVYDTSPKKRIPAYCDRVLYHFHDCAYGKTRLQSTLLDYRSHPSYKESDHKPVSAVFDINVMSKPISQPVKFLSEGLVWSRQSPQKVTYHVRRNFQETIGDWIGLYKADFTDFNSYISYVWAPTSSDGVRGGGAGKDSRGINKQVKFARSLLERAEEGMYVLCYLTFKNSLCGISLNFLVC